MSNSTDIQQILQERGRTHGNYVVHARITQELKRTIHDNTLKAFYVHASFLGIKLESDQVETLDMICHKIGRIVAGDPNTEDHWRDIAGYATLVADRLKRQQESSHD